MQNYCFLFLLFCCSTQMTAQKNKTTNPIPDYQQTAIRVAYFGENMFHPGVKIGIEYPLKAKEMIKTKKNDKVKRRGLAWITGANLGFYRHKKNHTGLFLNGEFGGRFLTHKAKKIELSIGMGYIHTILDGETFTVDSGGQVSSKGITGQGGLMPSISLGWGKDLYWKNKSPWGWHLKGQYFFQIPYNAALLLRTGIELGLSYRLAWNPFNKK